MTVIKTKKVICDICHKEIDLTLSTYRYKEKTIDFPWDNTNHWKTKHMCSDCYREFMNYCAKRREEKENENLY